MLPRINGRPGYTPAVRLFFLTLACSWTLPSAATTYAPIYPEPPPPMIVLKDPEFSASRLNFPGDRNYRQLGVPRPNIDLSFGWNSNPFRRHVNLQPRWPSSAYKKGLSGCVEYGFTIARNGQTKDIFVIEASDPVFERYGARHLETFVYAPVIVDGSSRAAPGQTVRMIWQIEGEPLPDHPACQE